MIFETFLCNTYRSHLLNFTDIQYSIVSIFHFVPVGHLSCFQLMANYKSCHSKQTGTYFLSIQIQSRIFELIIRNVPLLQGCNHFSIQLFRILVFILLVLTSVYSSWSVFSLENKSPPNHFYIVPLCSHLLLPLLSYSKF